MARAEKVFFFFFLKEDKVRGRKEEKKEENFSSSNKKESPFSASLSASFAALVAARSLLRASSSSQRKAEAAFCFFFGCRRGRRRFFKDRSQRKRGFFSFSLPGSIKNPPPPLPHLGLHELPHRFDSDGTSAAPRGAGRSEPSWEGRRRRARGAEQWNREGILVFVFCPPPPRPQQPHLGGFRVDST